MKTCYWVAALLCGGVVWAASRAEAAPRPAPVTITTETYHGWAGAYRLSNGIVDAVVVPSIGRIMAFEFTGQPDTNPLFNNPLWAGKPAPPTPNAADPKTFPTDWHNYGGDKVWPSAQDDWPKHQPAAWPPDPSFDNGPYQVTRLPAGVRLSGPVSPYFGVRVVRDITLLRGAAALVLRDRFFKAASGKAFPIGIWSISQVRGDSTVYLPLNTHGLFPGLGLTPLGDSKTLLPNWSNWQAHGDVLAITRPSNIGTKVGVDDSAGWMACLYNGNLLFSEHFRRDPRAAYPDNGVNAEVFTNGDDSQAYMEMEALGPMVTLRPGGALSRALSWRLQRLPKTPANSDVAAAIVRSAMQRPPNP